MEITIEKMLEMQEKWNAGQSAEIADAIISGKEQKAADLILCMGNENHISQKFLDEFINEFSDQRILFDLIIDVYTNDGYDFPKHIIQRAKRISHNIPEEHRFKGLPAGDTITIWRGTYVANPDCGHVLRTAVSWTTDKTMAIWFANQINNPYTKNKKGAVWEATIARNKIIAFTQAREESEVIQHMNAQNPHILDISPDEWDAAIKAQVEQRQKT